MQAEIELALGFYRNPVHYSALMHPQTPLPVDAGVMLELATGKGVDEAGADRAELIQAALFFVRQVLLAPGSDHYRVLGLRPEAGPETLKRHYRLLMRLFHPDRDASAENWGDIYAARLNQAYTTLNDPEARAHYDRQQWTQPRPNVSAPARQHWAAQPIPLREGRAPVVLQTLLPNTPAKALAWMWLLALLLVGWFYMNRALPPPSEAVVDDVGNDEPQSFRLPQFRLVAEPESRPVAARQPPVTLISSQPDPAVATQPSASVQPVKAVEPALITAQAAVLEPHPAPRDAGRRPAMLAEAFEQPPETPRQRIEVGGAARAEARPEPAPKLELAEATPLPHREPVVQTEAPPPTTAQVAFTQRQPTIAAAQAEIRPPAALLAVAADKPVAAATADAIDDAEIEALLSRFQAAYLAGDARGLARLFAPNGRAQRALGIREIERSYAAQFAEGEPRLMELRPIHWQKQGHYARGSGLMLIRTEAAEVQEVRVIFELNKKSGDLMLTGFYHFD